MFIALASTFVGIAAWVFFLACVRSYVFKPGHNRFIGGSISETARARLSEERRAHGERVYQDFEFFYKTSLVVIGGVLFLLTSNSVTLSHERREVLAMQGGDFAIAAAMLFIFFVGNHVYSMIKRYEQRYGIFAVLHWQETGALAAMIFLPVYFRFSLLPDLLR